MSEWKEKRLEDLTKLIIDCPHSTPKWKNDGVIVLRTQNIRNGRLDLSSPSYTDEDGYQSRIKRAIPSANDIVLTREAPMGEVCLVPENLKCCLGQRVVLIRADEKELKSEFLFYSFQAPYLREQILWNKGTGTTVSNIRIPLIKDFVIKYPSFKKQQEIAKTLSNLDQKITLLRQQNQDFEELAQTLFKRWFVEFEFPDENGEPYKSSGGKMVASELGKIPEGWRVGALKNFISIKHGYAFKGENITNIENNQILVTPGSFKIGGGFNLSKFKYYNSEYFPEEYKFSSNDLVVTMTDLSKDGDSLGFPALIPEVNGKILLHNQRVGKVIVKENLKYFFYYLMQRRNYRAHVIGSSTGTTVRHTSPIRICDFKYIYDEEVMIYFGKVVEPNLIKIINH